ncbi:MAG: T9SS type A sorting domain-containing protein [Flavobacteriales bacterium]|nr:T9SS type A sorting domain-containing protein [Flavobacteriales bacterium]
MRFPGELDDKRLVRLLPNGQRDASFYNSGLGGGFLKPWASHFYVSTPHTVRRILPDGTQDPSFIGMNLGPYFSSLQGGDYHVYPDGRILMSGAHVLSDSIRGFEGLYCLIWFSNTGYLDTTKTHRYCSGSLNFFRELPNGQFIGSLGTPPGTASWEGQPTGSNVIRFDADGAWDPSFQANVWWGQAYGFLPLADGRVYAGGNFRITGDPDTLHLVRFMPDGSLDPTFNNHLDFRSIDLSGSVGAVVGREFLQLDEERLIITGGFELVDGQPRQGICLIDTAGKLLNDHFSGPGCGDFTYQGFTYGSIEGIKPAPDGSYYIWGAYHGYDDGTTNDTLQRMVSRLYGLDVGVQEQQHTAEARLHVYPNPGTDGFDLVLAPDFEQGTLTIMDATGRACVQRPLNGSRPGVHRVGDLGDLPVGVYLIRLQVRNGTTWNARWVKE